MQLPSGETSMFTGWPDFRVAQTFERRLGKHILREEGTRAVGEIQSPPGMSQEVKMRTVAQAGIYAIGQFALLRGLRKKRKIAAIMLYKDLSVQVAMATLNPFKATNDSIGDVSYKLVDSIHGFDLRDKHDLGRFASVFITVMKETLI